MGLRFRKSIKIAPGVKLNIGKKSAGVSVGGKYGGVSVNSKSGAHARVSAPGTGMSYTTKLGNSHNEPDADIYPEVDGPCYDDLTPEEQASIDKDRLRINLKGLRIILPVLCFLLLVLSLVYPIVCYAIIALVCVWWASWSKKAVAIVEPHQTQPKPFFRRWWFIVPVAVSVLCQIILLLP